MISCIRAVAIAVALASSVLSKATAPLCPCGYTNGNDAVYTELEETDFTTAQNVLGPASGWELQEYTISANESIDQPFARQMTRDNILYNDQGLQLIVKPAKNGTVTGAEIATPRNDIHYGSFRAAMRTSTVKGTCAAFFWFFDNARELDIELLSRELSPPIANLVIHSNASEAAGFDASKTPSFYPQPLPFDPTAAFHEYRIDWSPVLVKFYIDSVLVHTMNDNVPSEPGRLFLNHWSNGSPGWSGGPPVQDVAMTLLYVKAYFNSSDPNRLSAAKSRCSAAMSTSPLPSSYYCAIPDELRTPGGVLSPASAASSDTAASYPTSYVGSDASAAAGLPVAVPTSALPVPGQVPFLSSVPGNVVGQVAYNVTYNCTGCPKSPNAGERSNKTAATAWWWAWVCMMVALVLDG